MCEDPEHRNTAHEGKIYFMQYRHTSNCQTTAKWGDKLMKLILLWRMYVK